MFNALFQWLVPIAFLFVFGGFALRDAKRDMEPRDPVVRKAILTDQVWWASRRTRRERTRNHVRLRSRR